MSAFLIDSPSDVHDKTLDFWSAALVADPKHVHGDYHILDGRWVIMADPTGKELCVVNVMNSPRPQADRGAFERKAKAVG